MIKRSSSRICLQLALSAFSFWKTIRSDKEFVINKEGRDKGKKGGRARRERKGGEKGWREGMGKEKEGKKGREGKGEGREE